MRNIEIIINDNGYSNCNERFIGNQYENKLNQLVFEFPECYIGKNYFYYAVFTLSNNKTVVRQIVNSRCVIDNAITNTHGLTILQVIIKNIEGADDLSDGLVIASQPISCFIKKASYNPENIDEESIDANVKLLLDEFDALLAEVRTIDGTMDKYIGILDTKANNLDYSIADLNKKIASITDGASDMAEVIDARGDFTTVGERLNKKPYYFDNVADMKSSKLKAGDLALTNGYYEYNDGGAGDYKIVSDSTLVDDGGSVHTLDNGLKAVLLVRNSIVTVKQFGAKGDGVTDDTEFIQTAINFCCLKLQNLYLLEGCYLISDKLTISKSINILGVNADNTIVKINNNTTDGIEINQSYSRLENIKFIAPKLYNDKSLVILSTTPDGHKWGEQVRKCIFEGNDNTGNGILIKPVGGKGLMNSIIENNIFTGLRNGIYFDIDNPSWANGGTIKDSWVYNCVNGMDFKESNLAISNWLIHNFNGQYHAGVSECLINNLIGNAVFIEGCLLWDGGYTLIIHHNSKFIKVNTVNLNKNNFINNGYETQILEDYEKNETGNYYKFEDKFYGNTLNPAWNQIKSTGASIETIVSAFNNYISPCVALKTGALSGNEARLDFNDKCIFDENNTNVLNFKFALSSIENLEFYIGFKNIKTYNTGKEIIQGNLIRLDTSNDNKLYGVSKHYTSEETQELVSALQANTWYKCQILYENLAGKVHFWINDVYIGSLTPQRYDTQPFISIKTLDNTEKILYVGNVIATHYVF